MMSETETDLDLSSCSLNPSPEPQIESGPLGVMAPAQYPYSVDNNEPLQNAVDKFKETGDMIHIVKQELRWHLLYKRSKEGKEEIETEENSPKDYKLREEEILKITRRREQNRKAAQRCRQRKKNRILDLERSIKHLWSQLQSYQQDNNRLRIENNNLKIEKQQYKRLAQAVGYAYHGSFHPADNYMSPMPNNMPGYPQGYPNDNQDMGF